MPPRTKPCGTPAAAVYHKRHGEPVDDACAEALNRYNTAWSRKQRTQAPIRRCDGCGRERPIQRRTWCGSCYTRWWKAGKPKSGPPPLLTPDELRAVRARAAATALAAQQLKRAVERGGWKWAA